MKNRIFILGLLFWFTAMGSLQAQSMQNTKHYRSHFLYQTGISVNTGVGEINFAGRHLKNKLFSFGVDQVIAYQFNPHFDLGVDLGLNIWKRTAFIPVGLHMAVDFMKTNVTPMWYLNGGYSFKWYVSSKPEKMTHVIYGAKPGWYINSGIGVKVQVRDQVYLSFAADYKMQYSSLQYYEDEHNTDFDYSSVTTNRIKNHFYHFVGVKIAVHYW
jgi:hypothetical protein